jgi:competence protein ComEA
MDGPAAWRVLEEPAAPAGSVPEAQGPPSGGSSRLIPIVATVVAAALAIAGIFVSVSGSHPSVGVEGDGPPVGDSGGARPSGALARASAGVLIVDVQGAVVHPGVVRLGPGARVGDAVAAAGGYGPRVDVDRVARALNMAALVRDGDQIVVPSRDDRASEAPRASAGTSGGGGPSALVDLNAANASELDALPGIGPVTAAKIIAAREEQPFTSVEDLRTRKLVGSATFDKLQTLVTVR